MAIARKCDRCRQCFDPLEQKGTMIRFRNPVVQTSSDVREIVAGKMYPTRSVDDYIDLCPSCGVEFKVFMMFDEFGDDDYRRPV